MLSTGAKTSKTSKASCRPCAAPAVAAPPKPKIFSNIRPIDLEENIGGRQGKYTAVSILEPVIRIERSGVKHREGETGLKPVYRIILNFKMQLSINKSAEQVQPPLKR